MEKLKQILQGQTDNHILPFLWIHGEDADTLRAEIGKIYDSGIRALCVEARPHADFGGPKWFEDLGVILAECKRRGMQMWLLDDSHFPTGFANGEVKKNHPELQKKYLCLKTYDFVGPIEGSGAILKYVLRSPADKILGIFLQKRTGFEEIDVSESFDLTDRVRMYDDFNTGKPNCDIIGRPLPGTQPPCPMVDFDLPEGEWSLNVLTVSFKGGEKETEGYLNPIDPAATKILLDTVYEPVWERFKEEFGKTFRGFFSDEPRFGNIHGAENASIGRNSTMVLPWRDDLDELLANACRGTLLGGLDAKGLHKYLPLLFIGDCKEAHVLRYVYMDLVSRLYSEHFDGVLGKWCHDRGVERIGHVIEDNDAVARLGYGPGHYFRSMAHADMAGIDVVIHQLMPGLDQGMFKGFHSPGWDGEFFTYVLGKLGGSFAHLDPLKKGRCMCELFGAYGWAEGNRLAKWLADYMLVRGVNELVPHAFDPKEFPDGDCPPHFFAEGYNPQYPEFRILMDYCNRLCDLLSGGTARMSTALLFHAEAEWSGSYQPMQKAAAKLGRALIDYDIVPADYLYEAEAKDGLLAIHTARFKALVVPCAEALPEKLLHKLLAFADAGVKLCFVDALPARTSEGAETAEFLAALQEKAAVVTLDELAPRLIADGIPELRPDKDCPYLRSYHYTQSDAELYFFVNEHPGTRVQIRITGAAPGFACVYDPFANKLAAEAEPFALDLPPYGSKLVVVTKEPLVGEPEPVIERVPMRDLHKCTLSLAPMQDKCAVWSEPISLDEPVYVSSLPGYATFSGRIRYTFRFDAMGEACNLLLYGVREAATVTLNGEVVGTKICLDYRFPMTLLDGENELIIELNTTLGRAMNDFLSQYLPVEPTGLNGVTLEMS